MPGRLNGHPFIAQASRLANRLMHDHLECTAPKTATGQEPNAHQFLEKNRPESRCQMAIGSERGVQVAATTPSHVVLGSQVPGTGAKS